MRSKHNHKHKKKYVATGTMQAQACLYLCHPGSHIHFLVILYWCLKFKLLHTKLSYFVLVPEVRNRH